MLLVIGVVWVLVVGGMFLDDSPEYRRWTRLAVRSAARLARGASALVR